MCVCKCWCGWAVALSPFVLERQVQMQVGGLGGGAGCSGRAGCVVGRGQGPQLRVGVAENNGGLLLY